MKKIVLEAVRNQIALIVRADNILSQIEDIPQQQFGVKMLDTQIKTLYKEMQKYEELKNNLYEDMTDGIISREEYRDIKQTFSKKIETGRKTQGMSWKKREKECCPMKCVHSNG